MFGILMAMMDTLSMVGMLIGVDNAVIGFGVHLVNSAIIGAIFGTLAWPLAGEIGPMLGAGLVYGVIWWVLGALLIMPLWLSVTADPMMCDMVFAIAQDQWLSLLGHTIFGLITATVLYGLWRRTHDTDRAAAVELEAQQLGSLEELAEPFHGDRVAVLGAGDLTER